MKNKLKNIFTGFIAALVVLLSACSNSLSSPEIKKGTNDINDKSLVEVHVSVRNLSRTALPDFSDSEITLEDLSNVKFYYSKDKDSWGDYYYNSISSLESSSISLKEGTWYLRIQAYCNSTSTYFLSETVEAEVRKGGVNTFYFHLKPDYHYDSNNGSFNIKILFPEGTKPELADYSGVYLSGDYENKLKIFSNEYAIVSEEGSAPYFELQKNSLSSSYTYLLDFTFKDTETNKVFIYSTSVNLLSNQTSYEEYTVEKFYPSNTITYHYPDETTSVQYYSSVFGVKVKNPKQYNWFFDSGCTEAAPEEFSHSGDFHLYTSAEANTVTLFFKDLEGNDVTNISLSKGDSFNLYSGTGSVNTSKGTTSLEKEGFGVNSFYKDIEKNNYFHTYNNYYMYENTTVYIEYVADVKMTIRDINTDEELGVLTVKNNYYSLRAWDVSSNSNTVAFEKIVVAYYLDKEKTQKKNIGYDYKAYEDFTLYVKFGETVTYNSFEKKLYKLPLNGNNSVLFTDGYRVDYNQQYLWIDNYSDYTESKTIAYMAIDESQPFSYDEELIEVEVKNGIEPLEVTDTEAAERTAASKDKYVCLDSEDEYFAQYTYSVKNGTNYSVDWIDQSEGFSTIGVPTVDCYITIYNFDTGSVLTSTDDADKLSFTGPESGVVIVYVRPLSSSNSRLQCAFHIYENVQAED